MPLNKTKFSIVIFAHNISGLIGSCIKSVLLNTTDNEFILYIIANGCTDSTETVVQNLQEEYPNIHLVSISMADKANAWNYYVHHLAAEATVHFFIDGDVEIEQNALSSIAHTMDSNPAINAVGGVPVVGRDQIGWINRMISFGRVSGGLYALRDSFLHGLRQNQVKLPIGFIGDDFLVSAWAKDRLNLQNFYRPSPFLQIDKQAGFSFCQLSPLRIGDYPNYLRRLVRYRIRDYQLSMLINYVKTLSTQIMPLSVEHMYEKTDLLPRYYWRGRNTVIDWIAVFNIRQKAKKTRNL